MKSGSPRCSSSEAGLLIVVCCCFPRSPSSLVMAVAFLCLALAGNYSDAVWDFNSSRASSDTFGLISRFCFVFFFGSKWSLLWSFSTTLVRDHLLTSYSQTYFLSYFYQQSLVLTVQPRFYSLQHIL